MSCGDRQRKAQTERTERVACRWYSICPMRRYQATGMVDDEMINSYCLGDWSSCVRFRMEEQGEYHPDNMLPDGTIDNNLS